MQFENRQPPEGINVTPVHPLVQFIKLLLGAALFIVLVVIFLQFTGSWLAKRIPFRYEAALMKNVDVEFGDPAVSPEMTEYLNLLANQVAVHLPLPEDNSVRVHYNSEGVFNAFATIGGNVTFYKGLLEKIPHENALAMVMAHEMAHVVHRDPIAGLGGGIASMLALLVITGQSESSFAGRFLTQTGGITGMQFTRQMENAADRAALSAVGGLYGHVAGADALFQLIADEHGDSSVPTWLARFASTHPLDTDRITHFRDQAQTEHLSLTGDITALPIGFQRWLEVDGG